MIRTVAAAIAIMVAAGSASYADNDERIIINRNTRNGLVLAAVPDWCADEARLEFRLQEGSRLVDQPQELIRLAGKVQAQFVGRDCPAARSIVIRVIAPDLWAVGGLIAAAPDWTFARVSREQLLTHNWESL